MMVAGIGFKKGASAEGIFMAINQALQHHHLKQEDIAAFATLDEKSQEEGLRSIAKKLNIPIIALSRERLKEFSHKAITISKMSMIATGLPSLAETAALAAIGHQASLLGPRVTSNNATCAIAAGPSDKHLDSTDQHGTKS